MSYRIMGLVSERRSTSTNPTRLKVDAIPVHANTAGISSDRGSIRSRRM
jgi:hypothetical protein